MEVAENGANGEHDELDDLGFSNVSADSAGFDQVVGYIQDVLVEESFQLLLQSFLEKHCREFDYNEENKLQYTDIFNEYIDVIENYVERALRERMPGFNMPAFLSEMGARSGELDGEVFEMLSSFADFVTFKQLVLDYKAVQDGLVADMSIGVRASSH